MTCFTKRPGTSFTLSRWLDRHGEVMTWLLQHRYQIRAGDASVVRQSKIGSADRVRESGFDSNTPAPVDRRAPAVPTRRSAPWRSSSVWQRRRVFRDCPPSELWHRRDTPNVADTDRNGAHSDARHWLGSAARALRAGAHDCVPRESHRARLAAAGAEPVASAAPVPARRENVPPCPAFGDGDSRSNAVEYLASSATLSVAWPRLATARSTTEYRGPSTWLAAHRR